MCQLIISFTFQKNYDTTPSQPFFALDGTFRYGTRFGKFFKPDVKEFPVIYYNYICIISRELMNTALFSYQTIKIQTLVNPTPFL